MTMMSSLGFQMCMHSIRKSGIGDGLDHDLHIMQWQASMDLVHLWFLRCQIMALEDADEAAIIGRSRILTLAALGACPPLWFQHGILVPEAHHALSGGMTAAMTVSLICATATTMAATDVSTATSMVTTAGGPAELATPTFTVQPP